MSCIGFQNIVVTVQDSGTGIDAENVERIFDRFFTTKTQGMGMGLAICRSIIEAHNGAIGQKQASNTVRSFGFHCRLPVDVPDLHGHPSRPQQCPLFGGNPDITRWAVSGRKMVPPTPSAAKRYALRLVNTNRRLLLERNPTAGLRGSRYRRFTAARLTPPLPPDAHSGSSVSRATR